MMETGKAEGCSWARTPLYQRYHDKEWEIPAHDDTKLFEMLMLEGMRAVCRG